VTADLAQRAARWAGIRSEFIAVRGIRVHLLRADAGPAAPPHAPTQLLLHGLGSAAGAWLDVIPGLTAFGPVIAVDLPGAGRTVPPHRRAARPEAHAPLLSALTATLGLDHVTVHGWSMGALVAVLLAAAEPHRVGRLVLTSPPLPGPLGPLGVLGWSTLGRFVLFAGAPVARMALRRVARRMAARDQLLKSRPELIGGDLTRMSPEIFALLEEDRRWAMSQPWRIDGSVTQWVAATSTLFVRRRRAAQVVARVRAPTLVLWGDGDGLIERGMIDRLMGQRPDWELHVFASVGHAAPIEVPEAYIEAVSRWLGAGVARVDEGT
jgi:pimeloyl-ACP methyl ester carboxylesterase